MELPGRRGPYHQPNILAITAIRVSLSIQEHLHAGPLPARVVQGIENLRAKSGFSIFAQKRQGKVPVQGRLLGEFHGRIDGHLPKLNPHIFREILHVILHIIL